MTVKGSAALIRLASNPKCEVLGAMVMQEGSEKKFYERVIGAPYDREFGERQSSRRRGAQFEQNAYAGDARLLREAVAQTWALDPDAVTVRNLMDSHPGGKEEGRIARLRITRTILRDAAAGRTVPQLIIQPQLLLPTQPGPRPYFFIAPDFMVRSPVTGLYLPGDLKSFIVRENEVAATDLARVRLQLGAQVLALRHEYHAFDPATIVDAKGLLVFSKPNGLRPHAPRLEDLGGAVEAVQIGIAAFLRHRARIDGLRAGAEPYTVAADLTPNFQDSCLASCVMAQWCRQRVAGRTGDMGDAARDILGDLEIDRVIGLMDGSVQPANEQERIIAEQLRAIASRQTQGRAA